MRRLPLLALALATPCRADEADIANGITSYRLTARYCHWPIPANLDAVLNSDAAHFSRKNPSAFQKGVQEAQQNFADAHTDANYCEEIRESRDSMTADLKSRAK